ncbi:LPXTG cell wall anchor domain-containing protein [Companilactobacillus jidongensis]|uniref:LPXTG cell wall anchor domain-containing protein n=1 Tax=Companilactobacillus jidongensis TaxID=2486006 RepID=UPI0013DDD20B|nr:LPXTG cell wall anchor domain-containing protein [Companilactobacillus jidongensis]
MKRKLVKLLTAVMLLGGVTTVVENNLPMVSTTQVAQASSDTTNSQNISYDVYQSGTDNVDSNSVYFTKTAKISQNGDGTYKVTLTMSLPKLKSLSVTSIDGQTPDVSANYDDNGTTKQDVSFTVNSLDELNNKIAGTLESKTKALGIELTKSNVDFKFDTATASGATNSRSTLLDNLKSITDATKANSQTTTTMPLISDNTDTSKNVIIEDPKSTTTITKSKDGQSITYKVVKNDKSGSEAANYLTNTATITPNDDGTYNVAMTIAYNKKLGDSAVNINMINNKTIDPSNIFKYTKGDNDYLKFNFNIDSLDDLSKLIPGQLSLNSPDYGLDSLLDFNLDFDGLSSLDLSNLVNTSDLSNMMNDLKNLSNDLKSLQNGTASAATDTSSANDIAQTLPKTGNDQGYLLTAIGFTVLLLWFILLRGTYLKN